MNRKKFLFSLLLFVLCLGLALGSFSITTAYLTASDKAVNVFTIGETKGEIIEVFPTPELPPGGSVTKEIKVKNTSNLTGYVRLRIVYEDDAVNRLTELKGIDTSLWVYDDETDFYYYTKIVAPGEETENFMSGVTLLLSDGTELNASSLSETFTIGVYAELTHHVDHTGTCSKNEYITVWSGV